MLTATSTAGFCACVTPVRYFGNDENPMHFTPPEGSVLLTLPDSNETGTFTYKINDGGKFDNNGTSVFTLTVGARPGNTYTEVLSWSFSGKAALWGVIVKAYPAFNLYQYNNITSDTFLVSPVNSSGHPGSINHVSIILFPTKPPSSPRNSIGLLAFALLALVPGLLYLWEKKQS